MQGLSNEHDFGSQHDRMNSICHHEQHDMDQEVNTWMAGRRNWRQRRCVETMFRFRPGVSDRDQGRVMAFSAAFPRSSSLSEKPVPWAIPARQSLRGVIAQIEGFPAEHRLWVVGDKPAGGLTARHLRSRPRGIAQQRTA